MGTRFYGVVACQNQDNVQEIIDLAGLEDKLRYVRDEHDPISCFRVIGDIDYSKKVMKKSDCGSDKEKKCWDLVGVPFLYAEGSFFDDEDHPNAQSAVAILRYTNNHPEARLKPGFSVDGSIVERRDNAGNLTKDKESGKNLTKTIAYSAALTVSPCNPKCGGALFLDEPPALQKSLVPPSGYAEALQKSIDTQSFTELPLQVYAERVLSNLKKSVISAINDHATLKCHHCGQAERFFKSYGIPNTCQKCGNSYTMKQVWEVLKK